MIAAPASRESRRRTVVADRSPPQRETVANDVSAIFAKLQVADRAEAMIRAREAGLGT